MTTSNNSGQVDFTHWLIRLIALIIDSLICAVPYAIIYIIIILSAPSFFIFGGFLVGPFIFGIIEVLYFVFLEISWGGATVGKKVMGLQVQMKNGSQLTLDKSFIRNISKIYGLLLLIDWLIAIVTPGADRRQKYTDRVAGTTVVQVGRAPIGSTSSPEPSAPPPPPPPTS